MSMIDEMIRELCPDGIEQGCLGDCCSAVFAGGTPSTSRVDYYDGNIPWIRSGEIDFNRIYKADRNITEKGLSSSSAKMIKPCSVVMAMTGATVGKVATVEINTAANQSVCALETDNNKINYRYLFYYLSSHYHDLKSSAQGALTSLNLQIIKALQIPLPPLPIQQEIVSILDKFTDHIADLDKAIKLRQKQFECYTNSLINKNDNFIVYKLTDICSINRGKRLVRKDLKTEGKYAVYQNSLKPLGFYESSNCPSDTCFIISAGAAGEVGYSNEPFWAADDCFVFSCSDSLCSKYLFFMLRSIENKLKGQARGGGIKRLSRDVIENLTICVPEIESQKKIVSILEKFESLIKQLTTSHTLRQKQYEYYRNKLLSFK